MVGQDKNRMRYNLTSLSALSKETTHHKVSADYFLDATERERFRKIGWSIKWPAILFSIGTDEVGAALAEQATRMRIRGTGIGDSQETY